MAEHQGYVLLNVLLYLSVQHMTVSYQALGLTIHDNVLPVILTVRTVGIFTTKT